MEYKPKVTTVQFTTHHTYPDLSVYPDKGGRLVRTDWDTTSPATAIRATLRERPDAVILLVTSNGKAVAVGLMPAGLGPAVD
jgi:hypothetical protein